MDQGEEGEMAFNQTSRREGMFLSRQKDTSGVAERTADKSGFR